MAPDVSSPSVNERKPAPPFPEVLDDVQDMTPVAAQTVELPHGKYIAGLQPVQGFGQLTAFGRGTADTVIDRGPGLGRRPGGQ
jgi:hypothetical protein